MVERLNGIQEVSGSTPLGSTNYGCVAVVTLPVPGAAAAAPPAMPADPVLWMPLSILAVGAGGLAHPTSPAPTPTTARKFRIRISIISDYVAPNWMRSRYYVTGAW